MIELSAALCEDDRTVRDLLARSLQQEFSMIHIDLKVSAFTTGDELLAVLAGGTKFDVYFLDIEMPGTDGIEVCRQIHTGIPATSNTPDAPAAPDALVVFISNKEELVFQSFEVQPFRFMRKSHFVEEPASSAPSRPSSTDDRPISSPSKMPAAAPPIVSIQTSSCTSRSSANDAISIPPGMCLMSNAGSPMWRTCSRDARFSNLIAATS